jgi:hypothetical protein
VRSPFAVVNSIRPTLGATLPVTLGPATMPKMAWKSSAVLISHAVRKSAGKIRMYCNVYMPQLQHAGRMSDDRR